MLKIIEVPWIFIKVKLLNDRKMRSKKWLGKLFNLKRQI